MTIVAALTLTACDHGQSGSPPIQTAATPDVAQQFFDNFTKGIANAQQDGYTPYWLGRGFNVKGIPFAGPYVDRDADRIEGGGIGFHYDGRATALHITEYSAAAWALVADLYERRPGDEVIVAGRAGRIFEVPSGGREPPSLRLIVEFNGTTLLIRTTGDDVAPGTPQPNPLVDRVTFLATMEQLRPYPD